MPGYDPSDVPLYETQSARDDAYAAAEAEGRPFFAVERYDEGYAVTADLMPAGYRLSESAHSELKELLTRRVEAVVGDDGYPTEEVGRTLGDALVNLSFFEREATAREVAAALSELMLDEDNWVEASGPGGLP
ncbi:hypothetical protein [Halomicrobium urmianum]|uniref:hypothetical protein n=1 Tax=Halomicrobium urmianum TaxID=1586233 RepID=UPI001CDA3D18|nr:hypothetical protein [Halomicrobium urmianum]